MAVPRLQSCRLVAEPEVRAATSSDDGAGSYLPLSHYVGFLEFLVEHRERIEVVTYRDFPWGDDFNYQDGYPSEWHNWQRWLKADGRREKIYVILQHDVDSYPERTLEMVAEEKRLGIRSNLMIFSRQIDRQLLAKTGTVAYTDYELDTNCLQGLEQLGFVIGYHSNAFEQSGFDLQRAGMILEEDVAALRRNCRVDFFSAHGGVPDTRGRNNYSVPVPESLVQSVRWVHNCYSPRMNGHYRDGGLSGSHHPDTFDLARFVRLWRPGGRYRVLTHPQYYSHNCRRSWHLSGAPWYEAALGASGQKGRESLRCETEAATEGRASSSWHAVELSGPQSFRRTWACVEHHALSRTSPVHARHVQSPIFVRGVSRSGGTLVVTLLDAHPQIAMSYELYPLLLEQGKTGRDGKAGNAMPADDGGLRWWQRCIARIVNEPWTRARLQPAAVRTYFARCLRSGLTPREVARLWGQHLRSGLGFENVMGRLRFIERCCSAKMEKVGKSRWGSKCGNDFESYYDLWPDACFIDVVRDGRDVLASQLNTGSFDKNPEKIGHGWANTHRQFEDFARRTGARAYRLYYERLALEPQTEVQRLCQFLEVPYSEKLLRFHERDLTVYHASHLSMDRITKPIDSSKIDRWKTEVSDDLLARFYSEARETLVELGYCMPDDVLDSTTSPDRKIGDAS